MQNILYLISKFGAGITFVVLEIICLYLVVNYNASQRSIFLNSTSIYRGEVSEEVMNYKRYFQLEEVNDSLAKENQRLLSRLVNTQIAQSSIDTSAQRYTIQKASIVQNEVGRRNNHFVMNLGRKDNLSTGMGVIGERGLLGILTHVTQDYALANSILHSQTRISCTVKPYNFPGSLLWRTDNYRFMTLESIPKHAAISKGDTIVTNGFSTVFPKDIMIGTIEDFSINEGQGTYEITVRLVNDVANAHVGYVVIDKDLEQLNTLDSLSHE